MNETSTFAEYYQKTYGITIKDLRQPLVVAKNKTQRRVHLIPELLRTTGLTDQEKANGKLMAELAVTTKKEPTDRNNIILTCARDLRTDFNADGFTMNPVNNLEAYSLNAP